MSEKGVWYQQMCKKCGNAVVIIAKSTTSEVAFCCDICEQIWTPEPSFGIEAVEKDWKSYEEAKNEHNQRTAQRFL